MKKVLTAVLSVLCVVGVAGVSAAGMMDTLKGESDKATEASTDAHKGMDMTEHANEHAIEAQGATKEEAGGMMDQIKEGAKGEVNKTKDTANETIDNIGK
ncbi:hypothetical protein ACTRXD_13225 [Nitrospira sp. T9]|uniref:hypothetical protein n=1 Tax=unclassified Nitrospira TaxID=2652172 RepID=UPI003F961E8C